MSENSRQARRGRPRIGNKKRYKLIRLEQSVYDSLLELSLALGLPLGETVRVLINRRKKPYNTV